MCVRAQTAERNVLSGLPRVHALTNARYARGSFSWRNLNNERRGCVSNEKLPAHSVAMYCSKCQWVLYCARQLQTGARTDLFGWRVLVLLVLLLGSAVVSLCKQLTACAY